MGFGDDPMVGSDQVVIQDNSDVDSYRLWDSGGL
jgi:hypothetical protein